MQEFFEILAWSMFWYLIIRTVKSAWDFTNFYKKASIVETELREKLEKLVHNVKAEKHSEMYYWFDEESDRFLAQGRDLKEISCHLKERFTTDVFLVDGKLLLIGPEYEPVDIRDKTPEEVGKTVANSVVNKLFPDES